ncbi:hypothetical protein GJ496_000822 [Pomphorhynchus laevis]|nr:hypothetical protein GJ496_000822 [Pomphorhynchus laevis]
MSDLLMKGIYGVQLRIAQKDCAASIRKENMLLVESRTKSVQDRCEVVGIHLHWSLARALLRDYRANRWTA